MLYAKDKTCVLFRDTDKKYTPLNIYKGDKKIAGWKEVIPTGESISQVDTYNDSAYLKIYGKSEQIGEPSPDNPVPISSVNNFDLVSSGRNLANVNELTSPAYALSWVTDYLPVNILPLTVSLYSDNTAGSRFGVRLFNKNKQAITPHPALAGASYSEGLRVKTLEPSVITENTAYIRVSMQEHSTSSFPVHNWNINIVRGLYTVSDMPPYTPFIAGTVNFPYTLRSLPDGTKDYIEIDDVAKTAKLYRNVGVRTFNGTEAAFISGRSDTLGLARFYFDNSGDAALENHTPISNYFKGVFGAATTADGVSVGCNTTPRIYVVVDYSSIGATAANTDAEIRNLLMAWITSKYNAGNPWVVLYKLATPTEESLDYEEIKTFYPYTVIYTTATIQPTLEGKIRVVDRD